MVFSSLTFLYLFLPVALILYYLAPKSWKNAVLTLVSLVFYAWGEPVYVVLMLYSILLNYVCGRLMDSHRKQAKGILIFSLIVNLLILGFLNITASLSKTSII